MYSLPNYLRLLSHSLLFAHKPRSLYPTHHSHPFSVSTQFNTDPRGDPNTPVYPAILPAFTFKAGALSAGTPASPDVLSLLACVAPAARNAALSPGLSGAVAAGMADPHGFINGSAGADAGVVASQAMAAFLLGSAGEWPASVYGAFIVSGPGSETALGVGQSPTALFPIPPAGGPPLPSGPQGGYADVTLIVLHNTTAPYASVVYVNAATSALLAAANGDACDGGGGGAHSITTHSHPLPFTARQTGLLTSYLAGSAATIM